MIDPSANPWSWPDDFTGDDVRLLAGASDMSPAAPLYQFAAVLKVRSLKSAVEAGSGFCVMQAVSICAGAGLAMPDWLAAAFLTRYRAVTQYRARGWGDPESFGPAHPKGVQIEKDRLRRELGWRVCEFVVARLQEGCSLRAACESLEIEMEAAPEDWQGYRPDARTIERMYSEEAKNHEPF